MKELFLWKRHPLSFLELLVVFSSSIGTTMNKYGGKRNHDLQGTLQYQYFFVITRIIPIYKHPVGRRKLKLFKISDNNTLYLGKFRACIRG